jgi:xylulokinase
VPLLTIGASYGDAFLAGLSAGILQPNDLATWVKPGREIRPDIASQEQYQPLYEDYLKLYQQTREIVHHLAKKG